MRVAVAAANQMSAEAGRLLGAEGGNAIDACVAASLVAMLTEVGICSLGGGGFITVWPADGNPLTVDGYMEMPGRGLEPERFGNADRRVHLDYGGGVETIIGAASVATPGAFAAFGEVVELFGRAPWSTVLGPAIDHARDGFPISGASDLYLEAAAEPVFGRDARSRSALFFADGRRKRLGESVRVENLADSLEGLATEGVGLLYRGELGAAISRHVLAEGGILGRADLESYEARLREPIHTFFDDWEVATNPGPAIGGAAMTAMLRLAGPSCFDLGNPEHVDRAVAAQQAVMMFRRTHLDGSRHPDVERLLALSAAGSWDDLMGSPSTVHVSTVDEVGNACAITMSAGYGSGVIAPGTGIWLNNSLGEIELNSGGFHAHEPGTRLVSNMAPTVARNAAGDALAIGSPGADRITTALQQTLLGFLHGGHTIEEVVANPRLHVELDGEGGYVVAHEPGIALGESHPARPFEDLHMYFGGVAGALFRLPGRLSAAADPRRAGGVAIG